MKLTYRIPAFVALLVLFTTEASAQCPGTPNVGFVFAQVRSYTNANPDPDELDAFIGTGCNTAKFKTGSGVSPIACSVITYQVTTPAVRRLNVVWSNNAHNMTNAGCTFICQGGGTCRVRGADALPVELMEFSVKDGDAG
jgi:hypothetical protein